MIRAICRRCLQNGQWSPGHEDAVDKLLEDGRTKWGEETFDGSGLPPAEPPLPLMRELPPSAPFPVDALGPLLGDAARAIQAISQTPLCMCTIRARCLGPVAQNYVDVTLPAPLAQTRPVSLYFVSVGSSGERKSTVDLEAGKPIRERETELRTDFEAKIAFWRTEHDVWKAEREKILRDHKLTGQQKAEKLNNLGLEPARPLEPAMIDGQATVEGLVKLLIRGQPSFGIFSTEGGEFVGGYSMSAEHRLRTVAQFSLFWDGAVFKRIRASEDIVILAGRRVSMHLMCQPLIMAMILGDRLLVDQGILSRVLFSAPETLIGTRFNRSVTPEHDVQLSTYKHRLLEQLRATLPLAPGKTNELEPRALVIDARASELWFDFADEIERQMGVGGKFDSIRGLVNKLPENAARIAAVLAFVADPKILAISAEFMEAGIEIARYYGNEALRLSVGVEDSPDLVLAQRTLEWMKARPPGPISLREVYRNGPRPIRNAKVAAKVMSLLEEHGQLRREPNGAEINGVWCQTVWTVVEP
jgi:hypothetical protein